MSLIIQTVLANLIDWLFKPLDNLCSQLLTGAFSGLVGSMSNDEWNVAMDWLQCIRQSDEGRMT